ncbi:MAG TPA: hypothetical protein PLA77_06015 [Bacteroidales bacterium]|nr:hypothetical protein [Bacteroidales bacterium]
MKHEYEIIGIFIRKPDIAYDEVQKLMTGFGCIVRTRLGINREELGGGIIIVDITGDEEQKQLFRSKLAALEGVEVQEMIF